MAETPTTPSPAPAPRRRKPRRQPRDPLAPARPGLGVALLVILLTTAALLGVMYLGAALLRLPFTPFDLYDWPVRAGFAPWAAAVDQWNTALSAGGNIAQVAPVTQWLLALALFLGLALVVGLAFYAFVLRRGRVPDLVDGITAGALLAVPMIFVSLSVRSSPMPALLIVIWLGALFVVWGIVLSYAFGRLMALPAAPAAAPLVGDATEPIVAVDPPGAGIDRRRFLLQFGAGAAAVTALSGAAGAVLARREDAVALQRTLPMISPDFLTAQSALFGEFRRFVIVRGVTDTVEESDVVALGTEYPDRNYVSIWLGGRSPIVIYENLETALAAYSTDEQPAALFWLDE